MRKSKKSLLKPFPEIGLMLAEAVEKCNTGKFKDFKFNNDDKRREFRIAA
nr:hypothetical protein [Vibrio campbellii]